MNEQDSILIRAFRRSYLSARSIKVKRETLWSSSLALSQLDTEVWVTRSDGSTVIERATTDDELIAIAARSER